MVLRLYLPIAWRGSQCTTICKGKALSQSSLRPNPQRVPTSGILHLSNKGSLRKQRGVLQQSRRKLLQRLLPLLRSFQPSPCSLSGRSHLLAMRVGQSKLLKVKRPSICPSQQRKGILIKHRSRVSSKGVILFKR